MEKSYLQSTESVMEQLGTSANGLGSRQAAQRLEKYGPNRLKEAQKISVFRRFLNQLKDPMLIILMVAAAVSAATTVVDFMRLPVPRDYAQAYGYGGGR